MSEYINTTTLNPANFAEQLRGVPVPDASTNPLNGLYYNAVTAFAQGVYMIGYLAKADAVTADRPAFAKAARVAYTKGRKEFHTLLKALGLEAVPQLRDMLPANYSDLPDVDQAVAVEAGDEAAAETEG